MKIQKIQSLIIRKLNIRQLTNTVTNKQKNACTNNMGKTFCATIPIVMYMATTKKTMEELAANKAKEASNRFVPNNTEWNEKQSRATLKDEGITTKFEQNKYLNNDGTIKKDKLKQYQDNHPVSHRGAPDEEVSETSGFQLDSSGNIDLESIDTNMCPELETIYNASPFSTPDGLVETIFDELPGGVDIDMDLWSTLKNLASDILNPGDLL